jgi:hypothetical protein
MFASDKALIQKHSIRQAGFCGGFTRGPANRAVTNTTVAVVPCPSGVRARYLALTGGMRPAAAWTPTCA